MSRLIRLYPPRWRARYEVEFRALLDAHHSDFGDRFDILRGAFVAWLNPRYGRSLRRSLGWLTAAAAIAVTAVPAASTLHSTTAEASPRYPVIVAHGPDEGVDTLQFIVYGVQRTIPHLILALDAHRSWLLTGVITERSHAGGPIRAADTREIVRGTWRHAWDFGQVRPYQTVRLTVDFRVLRPAAFAYSIHGYGALNASGDPDVHVPLTSTIPPIGALPSYVTFGTVGPSRYRFGPQPQPNCEGMPPSRYHLCDIGTAGDDFMEFDFRNVGRPIPHFVLSVNSRRSWLLLAATASVWDRSVPRLFTPRTLSALKFTYILEFGRVPHGAYLHIRLVRNPTGQTPLSDRTSAFGNLTPNGQPDPKSLIFTAWDSF